MSSMISSSRDRRALVMLIGALAFFAAYRFVLNPMFGRYGEVREEVASQRELLASELGLLQTASNYPELYGQADSTLRSVQPRLFTMQDDELATIALQQYVGQQAHSSSVYLATTVTRPAVSREDGLKRLQIDIKAEGDLEGILKLLDRLEEGPRLVQIASLDIRPGTSEAGVAQNDNVLLFNASIIGFGIDTAVVQGNAPPPPPATTRRGRAGQ
jgi:hypothetical protein